MSTIPKHRADSPKAGEAQLGAALPEGGRDLISEEGPEQDPELLEQLPAFELFFKTFGFKRVHGRVWGLLVLSDRPLSNKEVSSQLGISTGLTSTTINELVEWGALRSVFDPERRCHLHSAIGNTMSIVATILRRRGPARADAALDHRLVRDRRGGHAAGHELGRARAGR